MGIGWLCSGWGMDGYLVGESMKCPKCGDESVNSVGIEGPLEAWECLQCNTVWFMGHEEKVPLIDPWNPYMADDDGEKP